MFFNKSVEVINRIVFINKYIFFYIFCYQVEFQWFVNRKEYFNIKIERVSTVYVIGELSQILLLLLKGETEDYYYGRWLK